jgi:hypothetical protein
MPSTWHGAQYRRWEIFGATLAIAFILGGALL